MLKKYIEVNTDFVAYHRWLEAPEEVMFLRDFHRHKFLVSVTIGVGGTNRELEFFIVLSKINKEIKENYEGRNFESSCEEFAERILNFVEKEFGEDREIMVKVSEDGENAGIVSNFCKP